MADAKNSDPIVTADPAPVLSEEDAAFAEGLIKVAKDGAVSYVHPTTVEAHEAVGWRVV